MQGSYFTLFFILGRVHLQDPQLEFMPLDGHIPEGVRSLTTVKCLSCTGDLTYTVRFVSVSPLTNCQNCFTVLDESSGIGVPNFCLKYVPGAYPLRYSQASMYTITVECVDSTGNRNSGVVHVRILPNTPPIISSPLTVSPSVVQKTVGLLVYQVRASDPNDDTLVYTLTDEFGAPSGMFQIDNQGKITIKENLDTSCDTSYTLNAYVTDDFNERQGPVRLNVQIKNPNKAPTTNLLNREIYVDENTPRGTRILNVGVVTSKNYKMSVLPINMEKHFSLENGILSVNIPLNYELDNRANISFVFSNGYCESKYWLIVNVNDINDEPIILPKTQYGTVKEGHIFFKPKFTIKDEDRDESHTFELDQPEDDAAKFSINPYSGAITSNGDFDLDEEGLPQKVIVLPIKVTDAKGKAVDSASVTLTVTETNDNDPEITSELHRHLPVMDCTNAQRALTNEATDKDFGRNGKVVFSYTTSPSVAPFIVTPSGIMYQTGPIGVGESFLMTITVTDKGVPPRTSAVPITVIIEGIPCTTPLVPTTLPIITTPKAVQEFITTVYVTDVPSTILTDVITESSDFFSEPVNIIATVIASILGLVLLGLLGYCLWKLCCPACCGLCYPIRHLRSDATFTNGPCQLDEDCCRCCRVRTASCCNRAGNSISPAVYKKDDDDTSFNFWKEHYNEGNYKTTDHRSQAPNVN